MFDWIKRSRNFPVKFCTKKCYAQSVIEFGTRAKENNPSYKDGQSLVNRSVRLSAEYRRWRKAVLERDNYTCTLCAKKGVELHADHIEPFAKNPDRRLDLTNGRALCVPCHEKTPSYKGNYHKNYANSA
jgi:5-methylcytosine-specific restriction endonuclease McrA